jgi:hypothetical protein
MHFSSLEDGPYDSQRMVTGEPLPTWCGFVIGTLATLALVYLGVVRPVRREMSAVRYQMEAMQAGLEQLVALKPTAEASSDLVAQLSAQRHAFIEAHAAMQRIEALPASIQDASEGLSQTTEALNQLFDLKETVLAMSDRLQQASDVLTRLEVLSERLAAAGGSVTRATEVGKNLVSLSNQLQGREQEMESAKLVLGRVNDIQQKLSHQAKSIDESLDHLQDLFLLKDLVLSRTSQLADAVETLEVTADLVRQFQQTAQSFNRIRQWMLEVAATEPIMEQARQSLAPLLEISNLRRLDPAQLRLLAREMSHRYNAEVAEETESTPLPLAEANDVDWTAEEAAAHLSAAETRN